MGKAGLVSWKLETSAVSTIGMSSEWNPTAYLVPTKLISFQQDEETIGGQITHVRLESFFVFRDKPSVYFDNFNYDYWIPVKFALCIDIW